MRGSKRERDFSPTTDMALSEVSLYAPPLIPSLCPTNLEL